MSNCGNPVMIGIIIIKNDQNDSLSTFQVVYNSRFKDWDGEQKGVGWVFIVTTVPQAIIPTKCTFGSSKYKLPIVLPIYMWR